MIDDAILMAENEYALVRKVYKKVVDVRPSNHPLECVIEFEDGETAKPNGLIAFQLLKALAADDITPP